MEIVSVNVGIPQSIIYQGKELETGIYKSQVSSSLRLTKTQLEGDGQADLVNHGGPDKAICVYAKEHFAYWESKLGCELHPGAFGENLTVTGLLEDVVCIGDIFQIGDAVVQVSQPRQPCHKLAKRYDVQDLPVQVQNTGFTGYYFRVLKEGNIPAQPTIRLTQKDPAGITVANANQIKYHDKANAEGIRSILAVEALSQSWRQSFEKRLSELETC
ncbi:MOSC domain-containing protein [Paenibacillus hexagrammi]|uniref:MOSC domain-containing protein n=1 Tax=Paenibacillus hexagrammi TaxID=2908839 RepID=A0ABY3SHK7_9BACL|nr:MOSC domain-containing protein [Paenibacillus sp. YPD9-1]UJF32427.1 MOSC domain-containing protein [Paenibacillus sp. YPD9-1]